jgi:hypothetical protein
MTLAAGTTIYTLEALGQVVTGGNTVDALSGNRYTQTSQALADLSSAVCRTHYAFAPSRILPRALPPICLCSRCVCR